MKTNKVTTFILAIIPGVLLTAVVAWFGLKSSHWLGEWLLGFEKTPISGIMMAILIGLMIGNVVTLPSSFKSGLQFSLKRLLRAGIILLGIRLSLNDLVRFGTLSIPLIILCISGALLLTRWLGSQLTLPPRMSILIAVGTSICGATAIVATGPVIDARDEELAYAVANITLFGLLAMLLYPYLAHALFHNDTTATGLFLGTAIHETAQVAGGGLIYSQLYNASKALDVATVTKLTRNVFIAFIVPFMAYQYQRSSYSEAQLSSTSSFARLFPVFILGFIGMAVIRTIGDVTLENSKAFGLLNAADWESFTNMIQTWSEDLLAAAMAAVGLGTNIHALRKLGLKPFYVGFGAAVAVGILSIVGITALHAAGAY